MKAATQAVQAGVLGVALNKSESTMGIVVMPEFSYQKGQLWRSEFMALEALSKQTLNMDRAVSIQFKARKDQRDARPLTYKGRLVMGASIAENSWPFRTSLLAREGRSVPVEQLASSEMTLVEDTDAAALPIGVEMDTISGAKKFEQLGEAAYSALLDAAIEGVPMDGRSGIVVVDLNMGTGDIIGAWLNRKRAWTIPTGYVGFTDDPVTKEWVLKCFTEKLAKMHLDEDFPLPGIQKMSKEIPADLVAEKPKKPTLNVLVGGGPDGLHPVVPDALAKERSGANKIVALRKSHCLNNFSSAIVRFILHVCLPWQEWAIHEQFGEDFRNFVAAIEEEFGPAPAEVINKKEEEKKDSALPNGKKRGAAGAVVEPAQKKNKVGPDHLVSLDKLGDAGLLMEVPLPHVKADGVCIRVMSGNRCFVVNKGNGAVKLQPGTILAGFGAGNYKQRQLDELYDKEKEVLFQPLHSSLVLFNGHLATVEALVTQRQTQFPSTKVMYHDMVPTPTADLPHAWTLKRTHDVVFIPTGKAAVQEGTPGNTKLQTLATLLPISSWGGATSAAEVVFAVRWAPSGLMPTRPQVVLTAELSLPAGNGCLLTK